MIIKKEMFSYRKENVASPKPRGILSQDTLRLLTLKSVAVRNFDEGSFKTI